MAIVSAHRHHKRLKGHIDALGDHGLYTLTGLAKDSQEQIICESLQELHRSIITIDWMFERLASHSLRDLQPSNSKRTNKSTTANLAIDNPLNLVVVKTMKEGD